MIGRLILLVMFFSILGCGKEPEPEQVAAIEEWPKEWIYEDGSCQNTETRLLVAEAADFIQWADPEACTIAHGAWQSWGRDAVLPYSVIWVVPLVTSVQAQLSGAMDWTRDQQLAFLNDPDNLIILDTVSAKERGDHGPEQWRPVYRFWCEYATRWQRVKDHYGLQLSVEEQASLAEMRQTCEPEAS